MADIPEDIRRAARDACDCSYCQNGLERGDWSPCKRDRIARALLAERERWRVVTDESEGGMCVYVFSAGKLPGGSSRRYAMLSSDGEGELSTLLCDRESDGIESHSGLLAKDLIMKWLDDAGDES